MNFVLWDLEADRGGKTRYHLAYNIVETRFAESTEITILKKRSPGGWKWAQEQVETAVLFGKAVPVAPQFAVSA